MTMVLRGGLRMLDGGGNGLRQDRHWVQNPAFSHDCTRMTMEAWIILVPHPGCVMANEAPHLSSAVTAGVQLEVHAAHSPADY